MLQKYRSTSGRFCASLVTPTSQTSNPSSMRRQKANASSRSSPHQVCKSSLKWHPSSSHPTSQSSQSVAGTSKASSTSGFARLHCITWIARTSLPAVYPSACKPTTTYKSHAVSKSGKTRFLGWNPCMAPVFTQAGRRACRIMEASRRVRVDSWLFRMFCKYASPSTRMFVY
jgi:hypothetical protein